MKTIHLSREEIENIEDCIPEIERMFQIQILESEFENLNNVEELCELIIKKINLRDVESCTSQQAFYKLRTIFTETEVTTRGALGLDTKLEELFPRKNRKTLIAKVEEKLEFKLHILKAPNFISTTLIILGILSFIILFYYWQFALVGISISIIGLYFCNHFGKELKIETVRELVSKITSENYLSIRTQKETINTKELKETLMNWFIENSLIQKEDFIKAKLKF